MMGMSQPRKELFSYHIDLGKRVRADHPLRQIAGTVDLAFVRDGVAGKHEYNGNVSVDPAAVMKMMFLLFYDDVAGERELLMEGSFADAANNHGFKRARWRRLWRQQIQDWMIAAVQNVRILIKTTTAPKLRIVRALCHTAMAFLVAMVAVLMPQRPNRVVPVVPF